jgi:methyl-accepting chemotaxis protein
MDEENRDRASNSLHLRLQAAAESTLGVAATATGSVGIYATTGSWPAAALGALAVAAVVVIWQDRRARRNIGFSEELAQAARDLRQGKPLRRIEASRLGNLAEVGGHLNAIFEALGSSAHQVLGIIDRSQNLPARIAETLTHIQHSADAQEEAVEETASLLANINSSIGGINDRVDKLSRAADESASSSLEMGSSVEEVARNAASLHKSVEGASSSVHEMSASIRQVADNAESVQRIAEETAASMVEMDRTVQQVDEHVKQASALAQKVSKGADQGSQAVSATIADIERIHETTNDAKTGLEKLVGRLGEIAEILNVIGSINDETNLLSLNAAIIAAQAGERGKAFLVVANHVKLLAQRTAVSTKDIEDLIRAVQLESDNAMTAMGTGIETIEQGVSRSRRAGEALLAIRESAGESEECVAQISRAAQEQTRTSSLVARAAQETSDQVQQITTALNEQSRASEQMLQNTEAALTACLHVHRSTDEQRETGRYITESISSITDMIRAIQESTANHRKASESVSASVMQLLENARKSGDRIPEVNAMLVELHDSAESIARELTRFEMAPTDFSA